jgi:hypothetical protein
MILPLKAKKYTLFAMKNYEKRKMAKILILKAEAIDIAVKNKKFVLSKT